MIKGIIYDMDDLMVNSNPLHSRAWEVLLAKHGHSFDELADTLKSGFIGMRIIDILNDIVRHLNITADVKLLYDERARIFLELVTQELEAMPGLRESLEMFSQHGYRLALASSGATTYINLVLDKFDAAKYFDVIVSGDDVCKGKPDPETYTVAAGKLKLAPDQCLVLEDATKGIAAAKDAGCFCFAVRNPHTPPQNHGRADGVFASLDDIKIKDVEKL